MKSSYFNNQFMLLVKEVRPPTMHWNNIRPTYIHKHLLFVVQFSGAHIYSGDSKLLLHNVNIGIIII